MFGGYGRNVIADGDVRECIPITGDGREFVQRLSKRTFGCDGVRSGRSAGTTSNEPFAGENRGHVPAGGDARIDVEILERRRSSILRCHTARFEGVFKNGIVDVTVGFERRNGRIRTSKRIGYLNIASPNRETSCPVG